MKLFKFDYTQRGSMAYSTHSAYIVATDFESAFKEYKKVEDRKIAGQWQVELNNISIVSEEVVIQEIDHAE